FYREVLGLHYRAGDELADGREPDSADWLVLLDDDGRRVLTFQRTEELTPSTWPSPEVPMQLHLDFIVPDRDSLDAAHDQALRLGGRLV
ncbi:VOC family protein, partial [Salmonella enterica subsp. enterica serovar Typhimurium]